MAKTAGTILDRAVRLWEKSSWAYIRTVLGSVEEYEIGRRIAQEYPGYFDDELVALLSSPNPVVVAHALTTLSWMKSPALADLPDGLLSDERSVTIGCHFVHTRTLGEIAQQCMNDAQEH